LARPAEENAGINASEISRMIPIKRKAEKSRAQ
jgi:hypothetical protein